MNIVLQEEPTGCGFACVAMVAERSYEQVKQLANEQDIYASDEILYTTTNYVRQLLKDLNVGIGREEVPFTNWNDMPDKALLATRYRIENGTPRWHWCVYSSNPSKVFDPASYLEENERKDFDAIKVHWYIPVL
jgi:hypothetical protein